MRKSICMRNTLAAVTAGLVMNAFVSGCQASGCDKKVLPEQQKRFEVMKARGTNASMTVFPVVMGDNAALNKDVGGVVALMLEKAGMADLKTIDSVFHMPQEAPFDQAAQFFGEFLRENPVGTDYALFAQFIGNPQTGPKEIRCVIVDKDGQIVLIDRQTQDDRDFKREPSNPMTCCVFLTERICKRLGIPKSARDNSGKGRIAREFAGDSPGPDKAERTAMNQRLAAMKMAGQKRSLAVYPVRLSDEEVGKKDAAHLVNLLNEKKHCDAKAVASDLRVKIKPSHNEQKRLWDLARRFRSHIKNSAPPADYALLAEYTMHPDGKRAWSVHFVVCDRDGEWVIVDFQNEHHGDFQSIDPKTLDDCGRLVAKRLEGYRR